jgi:hypothetical protein
MTVMKLHLAILVVVLSLAPMNLLADEPPATQPTTAPATTPPPWPRVSELLGLKGQERDGGVYTVTVPRSDLVVGTPEAGEIPTAAGLETQVHFFMCPCGKLNVVGTFVVADYESNDVIDELRAAHIHVVAVAPALYEEQPRVLIVRFQGEGVIDDIAGAVKKSLDRTGEARNPKIKLPS